MTGTDIITAILLAGIFIAIVVYLLYWLYRLSSKDVAFVRTGFGGERVVINGGALVLPIIHTITPVGMRTLRLERQFDAVLLHDALTYMRTEAELRQAAETAFVHTRPGGVAIFAPDCVVETFAEDTEVHEAEEGERALRSVAWMWDPDPTDTEYTVDYVFMLREGGALRVVHDTHHEGLFDRTTWLRVLHEVGFRADWRPRPGIEPGVYVPELLWAERPA
jgi:hypothetical protein